MLVRFDSGKEDWIKVIDLMSDYPIKKAICMIQHYDFNPSNARIISWDLGRTKKIKRTTRRVNKSIKSMKAMKSKDKKNDRGYEILNNDQDCTRIDSEEGNEDWIKGSAKEA